MSENRVLRIILGLKRDEVTGGLRKLHNEDLTDLKACHPRCVRSIIQSCSHEHNNIAFSSDI